MNGKLYTHRVTIGEKRRENKHISDLRSKGIPKRALVEVFNSYYRDQVRALYNAVYTGK